MNCNGALILSLVLSSCSISTESKMQGKWVAHGDYNGTIIISNNVWEWHSGLYKSKEKMVIYGDSCYILNKKDDTIDIFNISKLNKDTLILKYDTKDSIVFKKDKCFKKVEQW